MSDADATQARRDVAADVDEIIEHIINANILSMPYIVYSELFDAVDGLGAEIENLQSENAKLRELLADILANAHYGADFCYTCDYSPDCEVCCRKVCVYVHRARELGVVAE